MRFFFSIAWRAFGCAFFFASCCAFAAPTTNSPKQWIVVTPPSFRSALAPLIEHRKTDGFDVTIIETTEASNRGDPSDGKALQAKLERLIREFSGRSFVLLAGTDTAAGSTNGENCVPALRGVVGRMTGEPSDSGFGLPDQDGAPTVAVGRFPARNADELTAMVAKTLKFENDSEPGPWRNRLLLLLGDPGGGAMADIYVQNTLDADLARLDPSWEVRAMFNITSSRFSLPRPADRETALRLLADGELFSVYLGHSGAEGLGLDANFIQRDTWAKLEIPKGAGPFFTCGCFACQSDQKGAGYGLAAMRNRAGPVAVIGASGESYSAPGQLACEGL